MLGCCGVKSDGHNFICFLCFFFRRGGETSRYTSTLLRYRKQVAWNLLVTNGNPPKSYIKNNATYGLENSMSFQTWLFWISMLKYVKIVLKFFRGVTLHKKYLQHLK